MKSMRGRYNMDNKYPHTKKAGEAPNFRGSGQVDAA